MKLLFILCCFTFSQHWIFILFFYRCRCRCCCHCHHVVSQSVSQQYSVLRITKYLKLRYECDIFCLFSSFFLLSYREHWINFFFILLDFFPCSCSLSLCFFVVAFLHSISFLSSCLLFCMWNNSEMRNKKKITSFTWINQLISSWIQLNPTTEWKYSSL